MDPVDDIAARSLTNLLDYRIETIRETLLPLFRPKWLVNSLMPEND